MNFSVEAQGAGSTVKESDLKKEIETFFKKNREKKDICYLTILKEVKDKELLKNYCEVLEKDKISTSEILLLFLEDNNLIEFKNKLYYKKFLSFDCFEEDYIFFNLLKDYNFLNFDIIKIKLFIEDKRDFDLEKLFTEIFDDKEIENIFYNN